MNNKVRNISANTSIVLDSLRIVAAITVLISHGYLIWFRKHYNEDGLLGISAHFAVIVFFVLSGYLIAHAALRSINLTQYLIARLSRLCSVLIPALLITIVIQFILAEFSPGLLAAYVRGASWPRYLISASFLNEIWFFSAAPPINGLLWSLSYEFWYYIIFGLWVYSNKKRTILLLFAGACLIAGPKILILMPAWLVGNFAYKIRKPNVIGRSAWMLVFTAFFMAVLVMLYLPFTPYVIGIKPLFYSNQFITDYLSAFFIACALWILPSGNQSTIKSIWIDRYRTIADLTFPLYLLHFPLLVFCLSIFENYGNNIAQMWISTFFVLIISFLIGRVLENKRPLWIKFFSWQFKLFTPKIQQ